MPGVLATLADLDERAHDRSHHLLAEGVGGDLELQQVVSEVIPRSGEHGAYQRLVGHLPAERREVVLADEGITGEPHPSEIERRRHVPRRRGEERIGHGPVQHPVAIRPAHGREASVEVVLGELDVAHDDVRAAQAIDRATERREIERLGLERRVERDDLTPSVHAGVGATRAGQRDRVP